MTFNPHIPIGLTRPGDYNFSVLLQLDPWEEQEEERLLEDERLWRKVNPHIGTICQPTMYPDMAKRAKADGETRKEFFTKMLNIFQSERRKDWLKPSQIRELQQDIRIDDLRSEDGWACTIGIDLSGVGDDLYVMSVLAFNTTNPDGDKFFADMEAWVSEECLASSPLKALYKEWIRAGWLHCVPGAVFDTTLFLNRVAEIAMHISILGFGYDPYKARGPINDLSAWVAAMGGAPDECVIPVRQNFATYNPLVLEFGVMVNSNPPLILFSANPMWPWEFSNVMLAESTDGMGNLKPVKSKESAKVDNVQALLNALYLFDLFDSRAM